MSWVDAELKKRTARSARAARETVSGASKSGDSGSDPQGTRIARLWDRVEVANNALPADLKLQPQLDRPDEPVPGKPPFQQWLKAPNGAGLGFNGEAIRYYWPQPNKTKSNNFWIRWEEDLGFTVCRRVGPSLASPRTEKLRFKESSVDKMLKCLVTGVRIKPKAIRVRRFWFF